jgi:hypothetical protein
MGDVWDVWLGVLGLCVALGLFLVVQWLRYGRKRKQVLMNRGQIERRLSAMAAEQLAAEERREAAKRQEIMDATGDRRVWRSGYPRPASSWSADYESDIGGLIAQQRHTADDAWDRNEDPVPSVKADAAAGS